MLSDLRESGCLAGDTPVYLPASGTYRPIKELVGHTNFDVLALNTETWQLEIRKAVRAFATGRQPVYRLTTRLGRTVRATGNHKFLTINGWTRLDELQPGLRMALPRRLPDFATATMSEAELALLGHLIGDGCTLPRHAIEYTSNLSRERAARVATAVQSEELLRLAQSDVYWDEITAIEPGGEEDVYDITVEGLHNFVAADIVVHNSIEQDADLVMFIYREEMYDKDTDKKGIAEIHIAKHRNGPLGVVNLFFDQRTTRFRDLAPYQTPPGY